MESPAKLGAITVVGSFVAEGVIGCAWEDSRIKQAKAASNRGLIRNPGVIFKMIIWYNFRYPLPFPLQERCHLALRLWPLLDCSLGATVYGGREGVNSNPAITGDI